MSVYGTVANLPLASGTPHNCHYYYNHYDSSNRPAVIPPAQQHLWASPPQICQTIASIINVDIEELLRLNPSLSSDNCTMEPGLSYCAREATPTTTREHLSDASPSQQLNRTAPSTASESPIPEPPICSFDPHKGEYICPDPLVCTFDPDKGEYDCPHASPTVASRQRGGDERVELR